MYQKCQKYIFIIILVPQLKVAKPNYNFKKIIDKYCVYCHNTNGNAPFSLAKYEDVKKRMIMMNIVINKNIMPPWKSKSYSKGQWYGIHYNSI